MNREQKSEKAVNKVQPKNFPLCEEDVQTLLNLELRVHQASELDYEGCWDDIERELERD